MKYKSGQKLVCVANGIGWIKYTNLSWLQYLGLKSKSISGPRFNEIVTVDDYDSKPGSVALKEYSIYQGGVRACFNDTYFEPLISDNILEAELASCREPDFI